jgi:hypothetical protein
MIATGHFHPDHKGPVINKILNRKVLINLRILPVAHSQLFYCLACVVVLVDQLL